ncbi:NmrA family transcriptional regulator, partial [Rhizobium ruizarguesonis]
PSVPVGPPVHLSPASVQPIASADVAYVMAAVALGKPVHGTIEIGGPAQLRLTDIVTLLFTAPPDPRQVLAAPHARYFVVAFEDNS